MTYRQAIDRKRGRCLLVAYAAWVGAVGAMVLLFVRPPVGAVAFVCAFAVFAAALLMALLGVKCPRCGGRIGYNINFPPGGLLTLSRKVRFCPRCGADFDAEIEPPADGTDAEQRL